jgi:hypothetical protein
LRVSCWVFHNVMVIRGMAKKPLPSAPPVKRRGRPPKSGGPMSQAEIQRAYRARLKAAGLAVRLADAAPADAPDLEAFVEMRERLHNALLKLERREQDVTRLEARNAYLEGELKLQGQHHTNALKEIVTLKRELAKRG